MDKPARGIKAGTHSDHCRWRHFNRQDSELDQPNARLTLLSYPHTSVWLVRTNSLYGEAQEVNARYKVFVPNHGGVPGP
jgi:hypothetical protein